MCWKTDCFGKMRVRAFPYPGKLFPLPVELLTVGMHYIHSHQYDWDGLKRGENNPARALIQYTLSGCGALDFGGKTYEISCGNAMLLTFPESHRYYLPENSLHYEVLYARFGGDGAAELLRRIRQQSGPVVPLKKDGRTVSRMRGILERSQPSSIWESSADGYSLLMTLAWELEHSSTAHARPAFIDKVQDYCRTNPEKDLSVETLSRIAGLSRWHFSREFKRVTGVTVPQFVTELRLQLAEQLIQNTSLSVKTIAGMCGFDNISYFIRLFRNRTRETPGNCRKNS